MTEPTTGRLRVNGAVLHYEVRGRGPFLLLIPGGTGGAASFDGIVEDLAGDHTVATYDPRGIARSPVDDPGAEQSVAEHAEDALRVLEALAPDRSAQVFGASSGAIVALHLLTVHPERLVQVVAHEPPVVEVLPDAAEHRAFLVRVQEALHGQGVAPAMAVFAAGLAKDGGAPAPKARAGASPRAAADLPYFLGRIVPRFMAYAPDVPALEVLSERLALGAGADSRGELPHRAVTGLADRLGRVPHPFPGGHIGLTTHPVEFGETLRKVLRPST
ncbi:alpha/beta hydrolase [Streptomyces sp. NPDC002490]|uniref:alpha/beta fold hydrolase n=1 Tax=Streptomyces sp. NPDC002490 TaxID=3154416 RepID=UPI00331BDDC5